MVFGTMEIHLQLCRIIPSVAILKEISTKSNSLTSEEGVYINCLYHLGEGQVIENT